MPAWLRHPLPLAPCPDPVLSARLWRQHEGGDQTPLPPTCDTPAPDDVPQGEHVPLRDTEHLGGEYPQQSWCQPSSLPGLKDESGLINSSVRMRNVPKEKPYAFQFVEGRCQSQSCVILKSNLFSRRKEVEVIFLKERVFCDPRSTLQPVAGGNRIVPTVSLIAAGSLHQAHGDHGIMGCFLRNLGQEQM